MEKRYLTLLGILGLDLLFLGAMLSWILAEFVLVAKLALLIGIIVLIVWIILSRKRARNFFGRQVVSTSASTVIAIIFIAGIIVIVNVLGARYSIRTDITKEKLFSLSQQTQKLLAELDVPIKIIIFDNPDMPQNPAAVELADEFDFRSRKIEQQILDPDREPKIAKKYAISKYGQVVVERGEDKHIILKEGTEEEITNAIKQLIAKETKKVYFITGHGELSPYSIQPDGLSDAAENIVREGFSTDTLNLALTGKIPDDAAIVAMVGPRTNPFIAELDTLEEFFQRGGKLLILLEPGLADDAAKWTTKFGVETGDNVIVDTSPVGRMFGASPEMPLVMTFEQGHPITKGFDVAVMFPTARSVNIAPGGKPGLRIVEIGKTVERAWAEKKWRAETVEFDEGEDTPGPVSVICAVENAMKKPYPRMVIFGDPDFITNRYLSFSGNKDLILNTIDWLGKQENLISIRPRNPQDRKLLLTPRQQQQIFYFSVVGLPFLALILAEIAWWRRQRD